MSGMMIKCVSNCIRFVKGVQCFVYVGGGGGDVTASVTWRRGGKISREGVSFGEVFW